MRKICSEDGCDDRQCAPAVIPPSYHHAVIEGSVDLSEARSAQRSYYVCGSRSTGHNGALSRSRIRSGAEEADYKD